jgi:hypothetical protein
MTLTAYVTTGQADSADEPDFPLRNITDVAALVTRLQRERTSIATIRAADTVVQAHVADGWGYLRHAGDDGQVYSVGAADSPVVDDARIEFPAGSGLPLADFVEALAQFVNDQAALPENVSWRSAEEWHNALPAAE